jgi:HD-like signal output (HDOD) protein
MLVAATLLAGLLMLVGWLAYRRRRATVRPTGSSAAPVSARSGSAAKPEVSGSTSAGSAFTPAGSAFTPAASALTPAGSAVGATAVEVAGDLASQRLWRLAFGAPAEAAPLERGHARVREFICTVLEVDSLNPAYFPRRPALMPQLLQAVNDPGAASEKLSRMIAHDPVLTADVLRLANSSLYGISPAPIESVQRAIVVCGVDALRGILAAAMLRPVFRASRTNFPRLPRMLWERTERAARAAELYALKTNPEDRFEAQLVVLLRALGPLVVYSAALDGYSRSLKLPPNPALFVELIGTLAPQMSLRIARDWQTSPRLLSVLERSGEEKLAAALHVGELLGTLSFLESQTVISREERLDSLGTAGLPAGVVDDIWARLMTV